MRKTLIAAILVIATIAAYAQETVTVYNPNANAKEDLKQAIAKAKAENKHVLIQVGGNWCPWCIKFHKMAITDAQIDAAIQKDYVYLLLNYSKENKNLDVLKTLQYPQRFGFPVFVVLDGDGNVLHIQDSGLLELDKGYDQKKVLGFLKNWNVSALDPKNYPEK